MMAKRIARGEAEDLFLELKEIFGDSAILHTAGSLRRGEPSMKDLDLVPEILDRRRFEAIRRLLFGKKQGYYKNLRVEFYEPPKGADIEFVRWLWTGDKRYRVSLHARARAIGKRDYDEKWKLNNRGLWSDGDLIADTVLKVADLLHTPVVPPSEMVGSAKSLEN